LQAQTENGGQKKGLSQGLKVWVTAP